LHSQKREYELKNVRIWHIINEKVYNNKCLAFKTSAPGIELDYIDVSDMVTFVWEIK
jgi:hypothetical protein